MWRDTNAINLENWLRDSLSSFVLLWASSSSDEHEKTTRYKKKIEASTSYKKQKQIADFQYLVEILTQVGIFLYAENTHSLKELYIV